MSKIYYIHIWNYQRIRNMVQEYIIWGVSSKALKHLTQYCLLLKYQYYLCIVHLCRCYSAYSGAHLITIYSISLAYIYYTYIYIKSYYRPYILAWAERQTQLPLQSFSTTWLKPVENQSQMSTAGDLELWEIQSLWTPKPPIVIPLPWALFLDRGTVSKTC